MILTLYLTLHLVPVRTAGLEAGAALAGLAGPGLLVPVSVSPCLAWARLETGHWTRDQRAGHTGRGSPGDARL